MSDEIIDLNAERSKREQPDAEFVRHDDYGRPLYLLLLGYEMDSSSWSTEVWAYDFPDAEKRVEAMRASLTVNGQAFGQVPA